MLTPLLWLLAGCLPGFPDVAPLPTWPDHDNDGDGATEDEGDCDDLDPGARPGAIERCDGADNDCNGTVDDDAIDPGTWYADDDDDGRGAPESSVRSCDPPQGYVADDTDCDDNDATVPRVYYGDADGDTFGGSTYSALACSDLTQFQFSLDSDDCDDANSAIHPGTEWHADADGDGFGDPFVARTECDAGPGWVLDTRDCDDTQPSTDGADCAWRDLSVSDYAACSVTGSGLVRCWGGVGLSELDGLVHPPADAPFLTVDLAERPNTWTASACGITETHAIRCWGSGAAIVDVPTGEEWAAVSVGVNHACALTTDGTVACWGSDAHGEVLDAPTDSGYRQVLAGENMSVALAADGTVRRWGLGPNFPSLSSTDGLPAECTTDAAALYGEACEQAVVDTQLGDERFQALGLEAVRLCGLTLDGAVVCAGNAEDVSRGGSDELEGLEVTRLAVGRYRTCVIDPTGALTCGGSSSSVAPDSLDAAEYLQFGASLAGVADCALTRSGTPVGDPNTTAYGIQCWGTNDAGVTDHP